jgi:AmmeMemoRadiSam system protein A
MLDKFLLKVVMVINMKKKEESKYVKLARETIENYIKQGKIIAPPLDLPKEMINQKAGVFVSLKKNGNLRGCIGTFMPTQENIAQEIIKNAISAAIEDPRFSSVNATELEELTISVDVLSPPEEVDDISHLDPKKYGVIVSSGYKKGLLLPDLEGVDTVEYQIDIAKRKAGIYPDEKVKLYRFEVKRYY